MSTQYELTKRIVRTISGEIHEAKDKKSGKTVAIKVSRPLREHKISAEDPIEEITVMKKLQRDEIIEAEENSSINSNDGRMYVIKLLDSYVQVYKGLECNFNVMEYAECGDIFDRITKEPMALDSIKRYFRMIVKGVAYLHGRNICHLDLSLENILLSKDDEIKICDFGQAQIGRMIKSSGIRRGKLKYMCPEVFQRAEEYDGFKADAWSIGIILWIMLTGAFCYDMPGKADKRFQYLAKGKHGIEVLLHVSKAEQEGVLVDLLTKILAIDPLSRLTVQQILEHDWLTDTSPIPPPSPSPVLADTTQIGITISSPQETEQVSRKEISTEPVSELSGSVQETITPSMISVCTKSYSLSSSSSSSSSSLPPFSPSSFPPPPPAVAEAPTGGAPPVPTFYLTSFPDDLSITNEPSTYGPLKRSKTNEKVRRRRRNSLFRHFSEHRKI